MGIFKDDEPYDILSIFNANHLHLQMRGKRSDKFYRTLYIAGFTPVQLAPKDCYDINSYRIGLTDLVHTEFGNDNEIADSSYEVENFIAKMLIYQPKYIAFNSKKSASFVLPSTSGSATRYWDETHWINLKKLIDQEVF